MDFNIISKQTARRFILGRQGLWPGKRWSGIDGTSLALRQAEGIQVDTINIIARSHDLALWSRVTDYQPAYLTQLMYTSRQFFDYGSILLAYPMEELVYWQLIMARWRERFQDYLISHQATYDFVYQELKARGPLGNRDFVARERIPGGFRTVKDTSQVLHYLWLSGEVMTHSRRGFERIYDFSENIIAAARAAAIPNLPGSFPTSSTQIDIKDSENYLALKALRDVGLATDREWARRLKIMLHRPVTPGEASRWLEEFVKSGQATKVRVEDSKSFYYLIMEDIDLITDLEAGKVPPKWLPVGPTSLEQVNLIAPLDNVIWDRQRTKSIFDFDYVWEVYKPVHLRRWGYYTMPILFGDKLVGRINPKLNRKDASMQIEGFWLEDEKITENSEFKEALQAGLASFLEFHGVKALELSSTLPDQYKSLF